MELRAVDVFPATEMTYQGLKYRGQEGEGWPLDVRSWTQVDDGEWVIAYQGSVGAVPEGSRVLLTTDVGQEWCYCTKNVFRRPINTVYLTRLRKV